MDPVASFTNCVSPEEQCGVLQQSNLALQVVQVCNLEVKLVTGKCPQVSHFRVIT